MQPMTCRAGTDWLIPSASTHKPSHHTPPTTTGARGKGQGARGRAPSLAGRHCLWGSTNRCVCVCVRCVVYVERGFVVEGHGTSSPSPPPLTHSCCLLMTRSTTGHVQLYPAGPRQAVAAGAFHLAPILASRDVLTEGGGARPGREAAHHCQCTAQLAGLGQRAAASSDAREEQRQAVPGAQGNGATRHVCLLLGCKGRAGEDSLGRWWGRGRATAASTGGGGAPPLGWGCVYDPGVVTGDWGEHGV